MSAPAVAYLASQYPAISHTFILREVLGLRALGFRIEPCSVRGPDRPLERLTVEERGEAERTFYVKRAGALAAAAALASRALADPRRFLSALGLARRLGGSDPKRLAYGLFYLAEAALVGRHMARTGVRHLHVHFATPAAMVGLFARRLWPITFSFTVHGPDEFYDVSLHRLEDKIRAADFVVCIGRYARSQVMKLSEHAQWSKVEVAPLGVDLGRFAPRPAPEGRPFRILCVGRLVAAKGQHVLLSAVLRLAHAGRDVRLTLVGDGPDRESLAGRVAAEGAGGFVTLAGSVDQDAIRSFYEQSDAFALASFAEGIPVVLMEAMAMEVPCVSTFITGIPELIRDGVDGLLVPPSDDEALAEALARLMDDAGLRARLGAAGRARVAEGFDLGRNVERLAGVFARRLAGGAA
ncbi:MAG: glycosyltransferase family 4 protein [Vicinamibacteria bacterium]